MPTRQQVFDFDGSRAVPPCDPNVTEPVERRRLGGQNLAILRRLREGPATNVELATIALKYTGRASDLRARGCVIDCAEDRRTGISTYTLKYEPGGLG